MLQLAVFDLDFTVWQPEMYQIHGPPKLTALKDLQKKKKRKAGRRQSPLSRTKVSHRSATGSIVTDRNGTPITVFDGASYALSEINRMQKEDGRNIRAAVASSTDQPTWARSCMKWLTIQDGSTLHSCFDQGLIEIQQGGKIRHFESLHRKTGIPFEEMCFFDDLEWNILSVAELGVKCIHTPDGMTRSDWDQALEMFQ